MTGGRPGRLVKLRSTHRSGDDGVPASQRAQLEANAVADADARAAATLTVCGLATDATDAATLLDVLGLDPATDGPSRPQRRRRRRSK